jgi:hypothetical protein
MAADSFLKAFDWVQHTLGDLGNIQSRLQLQRPELIVVDSYTGRRVNTMTSDVPDLIHVMGNIAESEHVAKDATLTMQYRRAQAFPGDPALVWSIFGEKGEIRLKAVSDAMLQVSQLLDVTIEVHDHATRKVETIEFEWAHFPELAHLSRSYGPIYEAYANGTTGTYADFEHALKRHTQLDGMLDHWDATKAA